ncbi:MAG TPA: hypothetical protein VKZ63_13195, partial [Kofleriaceae bacterium]|nr:hypothetical protein [Kofleriaceae bacterium]
MEAATTEAASFGPGRSSARARGADAPDGVAAAGPEALLPDAARRRRSMTLNRDGSGLPLTGGVIEPRTRLGRASGAGWLWLPGRGRAPCPGAWPDRGGWLVPAGARRAGAGSLATGCDALATGAGLASGAGRLAEGAGLVDGVDLFAARAGLASGAGRLAERAGLVDGVDLFAARAG